MKKNISAFCEAHRITRCQLSLELGVTRNTLYKWDQMDPLPFHVEEKLEEWLLDRPTKALRAAFYAIDPVHRGEIAESFCAVVRASAFYMQRYGLDETLKKILSLEKGLRL